MSPSHQTAPDGVPTQVHQKKRHALMVAESEKVTGSSDPAEVEELQLGPRGQTGVLACRQGRSGKGLMITLRRAKERYHERHRKQEVWLTFHPQDRTDPLADGFGTLETFDEDRLQPGAGTARHLHQDVEIVTYVREGGLAYEDSMGPSGVIQAGEFQRMTAGRGVRHSEANPSRTDWAHVFQISLRPSEAGLEPSREQKRFSAAERRGALCVVASLDARRGSLRIHQDALIYSAMLDPGQHVVLGLSEGRRAWLHLVQGEAILGDVVLTTGDGAGVLAERAVSLTAREETEILLLDLGERVPTIPQNGDVS